MGVFFGIALLIVMTTWALYWALLRTRFAQPLLTEYALVQHETPLTPAALSPLSSPISPLRRPTAFFNRDSMTERSPLLANNMSARNGSTPNNQDDDADDEEDAFEVVEELEEQRGCCDRHERAAHGAEALLLALLFLLRVSVVLPRCHLGHSIRDAQPGGLVPNCAGGLLQPGRPSGEEPPSVRHVLRRVDTSPPVAAPALVPAAFDGSARASLRRRYNHRGGALAGIYYRLRGHFQHHPRSKRVLRISERGRCLDGAENSVPHVVILAFHSPEASSSTIDVNGGPPAAPAISKTDLSVGKPGCVHDCAREYLESGGNSLVEAQVLALMLLEESTQMELQRIFSILDTDADGILLADDVLHRIEQTGLHGVGMLKQVITQAAEATKGGVKSKQYRHREGEITFRHFSATIQDVNRKMEQGIATKTLRVIDLQLEQQQQQVLRLRKPASVADLKAEVLRIEIDVLNREIRRLKKELITDNNNALGEACEILMATYENEQHVYECLNNFISYCNLHDVTLFRYNLEREGKRVHVLNSVLLSPPEHLKVSTTLLSLRTKTSLTHEHALYVHAQQTAEYRRMMDLSLNHGSSKSPRNTLVPSQLDHNNAERTNTAKSNHASPPLETTDVMLETLLMNPTLRKQFAYYAMTGNVTNLVWITRTNFIKFVKDCKLDVLPTPELKDVDITNIFAAATGTGNPMGFAQLLSACILIFKRAKHLQGPLSDDDVQCLVETHIIPRAKYIHVQQLAPDISQTHVMKLLTEHIWQFKQIFSHFGIQSLTEVDSKVRLDMKEFLTFARAFNIVRSTPEGDGEPFTPPDTPASASVAPISLTELIREYYAAKLDISITNPKRREAADLSFREFLRCLQRIALAMHVRKDRDTPRANGVITTVFEATKDDCNRSPEKVSTPRSPRAPRHQRRGNVLDASPMKNCKITSTSVISRLLQSSRAMVTRQLPKNNQKSKSEASVHHQNSIMKLEDLTLSACPPTTNTAAPLKPTRPPCSLKARRPITSGGPPIIRVIQQPQLEFFN
ncbi:hypothetical protein ON010_g11514 [Phytophthora cinnamomi]|nr:hypothetical protein ON010_g11514 [Phytophthora cinnamomi]